MAESAERLWVKTLYPTIAWAKKVDAMGPAQVHAIYVNHFQNPKKEQR